MYKFYKNFPTSLIRFVPLVMAGLVVVGCGLALGVSKAEPAAVFSGGEESELFKEAPTTGTVQHAQNVPKSDSKKPSGVQSDIVKQASPSSGSTQNPKPAPAPASAVLNPAKAKFAANATWSQNFTQMPSGQPSASVWHYDLNPAVPGWNGEAQGYTDRPENVRLEAGKGLVIEARKETYSYPNDARTFGYTSARIDTRNSFSFEYGKIEAVMKLPKGAGTWPAFWLLSANQVHTSKLNPTEADWATPRFYAKDGELDIMEHYGNWVGNIEGTMHTYTGKKSAHVQVPDFADAYHTYGVELSPQGIIWTVDGKAYHTQPKNSDDPDVWPFGAGNKLYIIFNLAMGGSGGGAIDDTTAPWRMEVQRVTYYPYTGS